MLRKIALILIITLLTVTFAIAKPPKWTNGKYKKYPEKDYLLGVGIGPTLDDARTNARAEISKIFKSKIDQIQESKQHESTSITGKDMETSSNIEAMSKTTVSTNEILKGVEIAKTYNYKKKKTYYALALLDKKKTNIMLTNEITDKEQLIQSYIKQTDITNNLLEKIQLFSHILVLIDEQTELLTKKMVVSNTTPSLNIYSKADITNKRSQAISKLTFVVETDDAELTSVISEKITEKGLSIESKIPENPVPGSNTILVKCTVKINPVERGSDEWTFYRWQGSVELIDHKSGDTIIAEAADQGQVSHITESAAKSKAQMMVYNSMASLVEKNIEKYIFNK